MRSLDGYLEHLRKGQLLAAIFEHGSQGQMEMCNVHKVFTILSKESASFVHYGTFADDNTSKLLDLSEAMLTASPVSKVLRNKVSFALVETYQNIVRHGHDRSADDRRSMFLFTTGGNAHRVLARNPMPSEQVAALRERIMVVNNMDQTQLKEMFLKELGSGSLSKKGGAGLGLIEMARRSGNPLGSEFKSLQRDETQFTMHVRFGAQSETKADMDMTDQLDRLCEENHLALIYKGSLTSNSAKTLSSMIGSDMVSGSKPKNREQVFGAMVAFIQENTSALGAPIILMVSQVDTGSRLCFGQLLAPKEAKRIAGIFKKTGLRSMPDITAQMDHNVVAVLENSLLWISATIN